MSVLVPLPGSPAAWRHLLATAEHAPGSAPASSGSSAPPVAGGSPPPRSAVIDAVARLVYRPADTRTLQQLAELESADWPDAYPVLAQGVRAAAVVLALDPEFTSGTAHLEALLATPRTAARWPEAMRAVLASEATAERVSELLSEAPRPARVPADTGLALVQLPGLPEAARRVLLARVGPKLIQDTAHPAYGDAIAALPEAWAVQSRLPLDLVLAAPTPEVQARRLEQWLRTQPDRAAQWAVPPRSQGGMLLFCPQRVRLFAQLERASWEHLLSRQEAVYNALRLAWHMPARFRDGPAARDAGAQDAGAQDAGAQDAASQTWDPDTDPDGLTAPGVARAVTEMCAWLSRPSGVEAVHWIEQLGRHGPAHPSNVLPRLVLARLPDYAWDWVLQYAHASPDAHLTLRVMAGLRGDAEHPDGVAAAQTLLEQWLAQAPEAAAFWVAAHVPGPQASVRPEVAHDMRRLSAHLGSGAWARLLRVPDRDSRLALLRLRAQVQAEAVRSAPEAAPAVAAPAVAAPAVAAPRLGAPGPGPGRGR